MSFLPHLWADAAAKILAQKIDESVLFNLFMIFWRERVPDDEAIDPDSIRCQACVFGDEE